MRQIPLAVSALALSLALVLPACSSGDAANESAPLVGSVGGAGGSGTAKGGAAGHAGAAGSGASIGGHSGAGAAGHAGGTGGKGGAGHGGHGGQAAAGHGGSTTQGQGGGAAQGPQGVGGATQGQGGVSLGQGGSAQGQGGLTQGQGGAAEGPGGAGGMLPGTLTHGFTIPADHPRLWWTKDRIAAAKTWLSSNPFTPGSNDVDTAFQHVVSGADCSSALDWATTWAPSPGQVTPTSIGSDDMRGVGESVLLVYDWCYDQTTPAQRTTFTSNWNTWVGNVSQQDWGGLQYPGNNYFWGNLRNELEWGIISYGDNGGIPDSVADAFIEHALGGRWSTFVAATQPGGLQAGGVPLEGETYGSAQLAYMIVPTATLASLGRDLLSETSFYKAFSYWMLYWTTPASTVVKDSGGISTFHLSTVNEEDKMDGGGGILWCRSYYEDWMDMFAQHAAAHYPSSPMASYARQWLSQLTPVAPLQRNPNETGESDYYVSNYILSVDPGGAPAPLTSLPLDNWATGPQYGVAKSAWDDTSTVASFYLGTPFAQIGHRHDDCGSFNLWRGGRWVLRETAGYSDSIAGTPKIDGGGAQDTASQLAHNVPIFSNVALGQDASAGDLLPTVPHDLTVTRRLDSQPGYFYVDADLTGLYLWDADHAFYDTGVVGHVEREMLYLRELETLIVLDRIRTAPQTHGGSLAAGAVVTSFLTHFETSPMVEDASHFTAQNGPQVLRQTVLLPAAPTHRLVDEGGNVGQYRLEVDASGAALRYHLDVLQSRDAAGENIVAKVVDSAPADPSSGTLTVTLHRSTGADTVLVIAKGESSSGGTLSLSGGAAEALRADVRPISYTDAGPVW